MQTIQNLNKKEKGFTLIELMIVVAIIGILAAIAIPQFSAFKKKAADGVAQSDLGSIASSEEIYYSENSDYKGVAAALAAKNGGIAGLDGSAISNKTVYYVVKGSSTAYAAFTSSTAGSKSYGADQSGAREFITSITAVGGMTFADLSAFGGTAL